MKPYCEDDLITLYHADCLAVLRTLPDSSVDAIVTDPPYGLSNTKPAQVADVLKAWVTGEDNVVPEGKGFMGAAWDGFVPPPAVWKECLRVLKPGGHMSVFAGARTQDLMGLSIRLAGFEIRDTLGWIYGSGFPKSMDISKAIDKTNGNPLAFREFAAAYREAIEKSGLTHSAIDKSLGIKSSSCYWARDDHRGGMPPRHHWEKVRDLVYIPEELERLYDEAEREVVGVQKGAMAGWNMDGSTKFVDRDITTPASDAAKQWDGWGTALKPAIEPIILARKSLVGTVAANVLAHGVGGLNIDASRVPGAKPDTTRGASVNASSMAGPLGGQGRITDDGKGRFPANVLLDEHAAQEMDKQSGVLKTGGGTRNSAATKDQVYAGGWVDGPPRTFEANEGGASRFFPVFKYQAKAPKKERPVIEREDGTKIQHPTVKPVALMEWLVELITPPSGVVLDPFAGSGTTLQAARDNGFNAIGVEQSADFAELIQHRLGAGQTTLTVDDVVNDGVVPAECESPTIANTGSQALKETL